MPLGRARLIADDWLHQTPSAHRGYTAGPLFTDDVIQRIFEYAKGLPRRINQVCTTALTAGLIDQKSVQDETTIPKAMADRDHE